MAMNIDHMGFYPSQSDDGDNFDSVYNACRGLIYQFCYNILKNKPEAEDVTAETLFALQTRTGPFESKKHLQNFLFAVARNKCFNLIETHKRRKKLLRRQPPEDRFYPDAAFAMEEQEAEMITSYWAKIADAELEKLPVKCREVFILHAKEGMARADIATKLDISPKTVDNHMDRARKILRGILYDKGYSYVFIAVWLHNLFY
jgi:RNA polymerase sigma-70 factor (ECF subfamily)